MYTIGRLAALAGCRAVTVRYYERTGLLRSPARLENGYRAYSAEDLEELRFVRHCRSHGFTIGETRELLALRGAPAASCGAVDELVTRHIRKLDRLLESVKSLRDQLAELKGSCPSGGNVAECGIMRGLMDRAFCPCGAPGEEGSGRAHAHAHGPEDGGEGFPGLDPLPEDGPERDSPERDGPERDAPAPAAVKKGPKGRRRGKA
jgi:DNA-binding transcriptional MerR regulator